MQKIRRVIFMRINRVLTCLMEESAEIIQACSKSVRFGLDNHNPKTPDFTNSDDIMIEYYQLQAIMEIAQDEGILPILTKEEIKSIKDNKKKKVKYYENERNRRNWQEKRSKQR